MITATTTDAAAWCGAMLDGDATLAITGAANDTRRLRPGDLFVALAGARDGHEFLEDARNAGASGALVRRNAALPHGLTGLRVDDPLAALARLAAAVRARLSSKVVAITGSAGKTCTKDFTAAVLGARFATVKSEGSFNNEIGLPLTILAADEGTEMIVAEIGARGAGHIASLLPVAVPDVAIVTNVGSAHVGMFGSIDAVAAAKSEIISGLAPGACAVLNNDDPRVAAMTVPSGVDVIRTGRGGDIVADDLRLDHDACARFTLVTPGGSAAVRLPIPGEHMVSNALAAAAAGHRFGLDPETIAKALGEVVTSSHRMSMCEAAGGWTVIDDAYNASPASVVAALKTLAVLGRSPQRMGHRTWAVLGLMAELGDASTEEHDRIGRLAVRLGIGRIVTVGHAAQPLHEAARLEGMSPDDAVLVADAAAAATTVLASVEAGDVVLVKASRVAGLERVVEAIVR